MTAARICAAPDCDNPLPRRTGQPGRPPIYCSPRCRPSRVGPRLVVEIDHPQSDQATPGRDWTVRLRRGRRSVTVGRDLGRFTAAALADQLDDLLQPTGRRRP